MPVSYLQVDNVVDWPVQLGPEFIHGAKSSMKVGSCLGLKHFLGAKQDLIFAHMQDSALL